MPETGKVFLTVQDNVVDSIGRFAGLRSRFPSYGLHDFTNGQGVQRFVGTLS